MTQIRVRELMATGGVEITESTSFPSLYHQDLALLRALESADSELLPEKWADQVLSWKRLLANWLLDKVREQTVEIHGPLKRLVPLAGDPETGLDRVTWLFEGAGKNLATGVMSPIVIVRPLMARTPLTPEGRNEPWQDVKCQHLIDGLKEVLESVRRRHSSDEGSQSLAALAGRLRSVLCRHFPEAAKPLLTPLRRLPARIVLVGLGHDPDGTNWEMLDVVRRGGIHAQPANVRLPECKACMKVALPLEVEVADGVISYTVECPNCQLPVRIDLEDYGIGWHAGSDHSEFVVWVERSFIWGSQQVQMPPVPEVSQVQVDFRFDPGHPRMADIREADRRLRFVVGHGTGRFSPVKLRDLCHEKLLWPMRREPTIAFEPRAYISPLLGPYRGLLRNPDTQPVFEPGRDNQPGSVTFTLDLAGVPGPIRYRATRITSLELPGLVVFPDPRRVPPDWKWFRIAAASDVEIRLAHQAATPSESRSVCTVLDGMPEAVELASTGDSNSACMVSFATASVKYEGRIDLEFGVDVGCTNSVVFTRTLSGPTDVSGPFIPEVLRSGAASWLIEPTADSGEAILSSILGDLQAIRARNDRALVPSELCRHGFIDWGAMPCCRDAASKTSWSGDRADVRSFGHYVVELLLHVLADACGHAGAPPSSFHARPSFAVPAGLEDVARTQLFGTVRDAWKRVLSLAGGEQSSPNFVVASEAALLASEPPNAPEIVLTADLGGASLDVTLGECGNDVEYFGSLGAGGRVVLTQVRSAEARGRRQVQAREADGRHADSQVNRERLKCFQGIVFAFLETALLGYLQRHRQAPDSSVIVLYLFGNGWRLGELEAAGSDDTAGSFEESHLRFWIPRLVTALSNAGHRGCQVELRLPKEPADMKLAVARGALAASPARTWPGARLPAGISFSGEDPDQYRVEWSDPFGAGIDDDSASARAIDLGVRFDFRELEARLEQSPVFEETGYSPDCKANEGEIRRAFCGTGNRVPSAVGQSIVRGPLQVLLEDVWIKKL